MPLHDDDNPTVSIISTPVRVQKTGWLCGAQKPVQSVCFVGASRWQTRSLYPWMLDGQRDHKQGTDLWGAAVDQANLRGGLQDDIKAFPSDSGV